MKKTLSIILSLVLCIACFAMPVYADDLEMNVNPVELERGFVYDCDGEGYVYNWFYSGRVLVTITVQGRTALDSNGNVTGFNCLSCSIGTSILYGSAPSDFAVSAHYVSYFVSNDIVFARVYYSVTGEGVTNTGYVNVEMSGL